MIPSKFISERGCFITLKKIGANDRDDKVFQLLFTVFVLEKCTSIKYFLLK